MPLEEALVYLRRALKRRVGDEFNVRFVEVESAEARQSPWGNERPLPLVIADGKVIFKGDFSFYQIIEKLKRMRGKKYQ